jgi:hypothetical protein
MIQDPILVTARLAAFEMFGALGVETTVGDTTLFGPEYIATLILSYQTQGAL